MIRLRVATLTCLLCAATGLASSSALAESGTRLAVDLDFAHALDQRGIGAGTGGALRLGYRLDALLVALTPEIGASYHGFSGFQDAAHVSGFAGGRLSLGWLLEPVAFAHVGVGHLETRHGGHTAPAVDLGLALDLTLLPLIDLGAHVAYDALFIEQGRDFHWYRIGVHLALAFGKD